MHLAAGAGALLAVSGIAQTQAYSTRSLRIIVGSAAGSTVDFLARLMGRWLGDLTTIECDGRRGAIYHAP